MDEVQRERLAKENGIETMEAQLAAALAEAEAAQEAQRKMEWEQARAISQTSSPKCALRVSPHACSIC